MNAGQLASCGGEVKVCFVWSVGERCEGCDERIGGETGDELGVYRMRIVENRVGVGEDGWET